MNTVHPEPTVGMPATINLFSDTFAAVVVRVNRKSVTVARVKTDPATSRRINDEREPYPCLVEDGILTAVIGEPQRYARVDTEHGPRFRNGSISVTLGRSVRITDYRH